MFFTTLINASLMWYGSVSSGIELYGPSRYHWDNGYFSLKPIGCNPSKGGLFRSGPILKGDGVVQNWLGHSILLTKVVHFEQTYLSVVLNLGIA